MMGCTVSTDFEAGGAAGAASRRAISPLTRIKDYQKESREYMHGLAREPTSLMPEELRYGYISANNFFNMFHAGFCAPYIANPNYMLLVDFRSREEFEENRLVTATHYEDFDWNRVQYPELCCYSVVVFYDHDGTAAANLYTILYRAFRRVRSMKLDAFCILGGITAVSRRFPHLLVDRMQAYLGKLIPWMPTLVSRDGTVFLGRHEQAEEACVVFGLGLTHVLSVGRSPENRFGSVTYLAIDGDRDLVSAFQATYRIIQSVINENGKILVHGVEGLNRSAAVVIAFLMRSTPCLLEEAYFYLQVLRPFMRLDGTCVGCLLRYEEMLFGHRVTEIEDLWI